jgi:sporulation protein YlmC with PRC-barrel domain
MSKIVGTAVALVLLGSPAFAQSAKIDAALPADAVTVTHWYKQNVYDPKDSKIGEVEDVLVNKSGQITTLMIGVGGFLGAGEKDIAVPFEAVKTTTKDNKPYLVMNTTKDDLKNAHGFKYDKNKLTWNAEAK